MCKPQGDVMISARVLQFLQDTGDFQQAEEVLNKVVCMEPENPLGHFSLGYAYIHVYSYTCVMPPSCATGCSTWCLSLTLTGPCSTCRRPSQ